MRILLAIIVIVGIIGLLFVLLRRGTTSENSTIPEQISRESLVIPEQAVHESLVTVEQMPAVVAKLQREGKDSSFAVFMFEPRAGEPKKVSVNLQFSIENGVTGLDWVLLSPRNIADKEALSAFIASSGHAVSEHEMNDVKYLRVEGSGVSELGVKICREFYHLTPDEKMELLAEGFEWQP
jgi:hypothetical protein